MPEINLLVEIPDASLVELRDKFKVDWPKHILAYNTLNIYVSRLSKGLKLSEYLKIFSLNGDWKDDGLFIAVRNERHIMFATLSESFKRLKTALKLLDYSTPQIFMSAPERYYASLKEVISEAYLKVLWGSMYSESIVKHLSSEEAKKLEFVVPENFRLASLQKQHAEQVNSVWPHRSKGSENYIEYMIKYNTSVGLFDDTGDLVAWCLQADFGAVNTLQVDEKHLRKGYGEIVTKAICKKIADDRDMDIVCNIVQKNVKSENLFNKLGFRDIGKNFWIKGVIVKTPK